MAEGMIIIPEFYLTRHTDNYKVLLRKISKEFRWPLVYTDHPVIPSDAKIVLVFAVPQHNRPEVMEDIYKLDRKIKLIGYVGDTHTWGNKKYEEKLFRIYDRYDLILSTLDEKFRKWYPQFAHKMVYFPQFFAPHKRYSALDFNKNPKIRGLLSGNMDPNVYPLRGYLANNRDKAKLDCRYSRYRIGDRYAQMLHSYFCCVATSSIFNIVVKKYFEIPATGSLLLANRVKDLDLLGFVPYKHYIPITMDVGSKENAISQIRRCLYFPDHYEDVRRMGSKFVRTFHSVRNRFKQLKSILEKVIRNG